jgi:hypothetical protein
MLSVSEEGVMEKDGLIYNPPAWRVCPECNGKGEKWTGQFNDRGYVGKCPTCNGTGRIPIRYTPSEWIEAGGMLSDDTPVLHIVDYGDYIAWVSSTWKMMEICTDHPIIIAIPGQNRPPEDWRPE